jgi:hypothetical protein
MAGSFPGKDRSHDSEGGVMPECTRRGRKKENPAEAGFPL